MSETTTTIIIPVFNTASDLLDRAVDSALAQAHVEQVILIDDGSTSACAKHLDYLASLHPGLVEVIHKPNGGVSSARNAGLERASGAFVAFLDADDYLMPRFVGEALSCMERTEADLAIGGVIFVNLDGSTFTMGVQMLKDEELVVDHEHAEILKASLFTEQATAKLGLVPTRYVYNGGILIRRSFIGELRFREDIVLGEDKLFNFEIFDRAKKIAVSGSAWYAHIQNSESASERLRHQAKEELLATAAAIDALRPRARTQLLKDAISEGVVECYLQTIIFAVLRAGSDKTNFTAIRDFVSPLLEEPVYRQAFAAYRPTSLKQRTLRRLFLWNKPSLMALWYLCRKHMSY